VAAGVEWDCLVNMTVLHPLLDMHPTLMAYLRHAPNPNPVTSHRNGWLPISDAYGIGRAELTHFMLTTKGTWIISTAFTAFTAFGCAWILFGWISRKFSSARVRPRCREVGLKEIDKIETQSYSRTSQLEKTSYI
jgi:hypothetical protein